MKTIFELDTDSLTIQEANSLINQVSEAVEKLIEDNGFKHRLRTSDKSVLAYVVRDNV